MMTMMFGFAAESKELSAKKIAMNRNMIWKRAVDCLHCEEVRIPSCV